MTNRMRDRGRQHGPPSGRLLLLTTLGTLAVAGCREKAAAPDLQPDPALPAASRGAPDGPSPARTVDPPAGTLPRFREAAEQSHVLFTRFDDMRGTHRITEANGGGVALFDYDGDGRPDVFFTDGSRLPPDGSDQGHSNQMFRGRGAGQFEAATEPAGLRAEAFFTGCAVGDPDGDGFDDLYVAAYGADRLWQNNGDGTFVDATSGLGFRDKGWGSSAAFGDLNRDGVLDLYIANYVDPGDPISLCPSPGSPDGYSQCPPTMFHAVDDAVYLGDGVGGFREITNEAGLAAEDGKGLGVVIFDADRDGLPDVYVANDGTPNFLFMNRTEAVGRTSGVAFKEEAMQRGVALNAGGKAEASMGVAVGDYDANGWPDIFITNFYLEPNVLYANLGGGAFEDATSRSRLAAPTRLTLGFGTEALDWDNDGWLDLILANGHIDNYEFGPSPEPYRMKPQLFRNERDGTFVEVTSWGGPYFQSEWVGRGLATGDLDGDGDLDVVVSHQLDRSAVLVNETETANRSVVVRFVGSGESNRSAVGTFVEAEGLEMTLVREVIGGGSFQSHSDRRVHVGLGDHGAIPRLKVRWPSGREQAWDGVAPGDYVAVEGRGLLAVPAD